MSFFKKTTHVDGPSVTDLKITFENICEELNSGAYSSGIDPETMANMLVQLYKHITNTLHGKPLTLPASMDDPSDKYRILWPEGARVRTRSRRDSHASAGSSIAPNGVHVPNMRSGYGSSVASSVKSSRYAPVKARFMDESGIDDGVRSLNLSDIRRAPSQRVDAGGVPVSSARRSERIIEDDDDDVQRISTRKSSTSQRKRDTGYQPERYSKKPTFIDD